MESSFIRIRTRWSSGPSEWEWRDLGHSFPLDQPLPESLLSELKYEVNRENGDGEHYRGCEIELDIPPMRVVEAELLARNKQFVEAENAVARLDECKRGLSLLCDGNEARTTTSKHCWDLDKRQCKICELTALERYDSDQSL